MPPRHGDRPPTGASETVHRQMDREGPGDARAQSQERDSGGDRPPFQTGSPLTALCSFPSRAGDITGSDGNRNQPHAPSQWRGFQNGFITEFFG